MKKAVKGSISSLEELLNQSQNQLTYERLKPIQPSDLSVNGFEGSIENNDALIYWK